MVPSQNCIDLIKRFEGCVLRAYPDPGPLGWKLPTIAWGHTGSDVHQGDTVTQEEADELLADDLAEVSAQVDRALFGSPVSQNQFDALCCFAYNVSGWKDSTLIHKVRAKDFTGAAAEFPKWCHAGKTVLPGLVKRRAAEQSLFVKPI